MLMTKAELVAAMAEKANLNRAQAKDALEAFINSVTSSLKQGQDVRLLERDRHRVDEGVQRLLGLRAVQVSLLGHGGHEFGLGHEHLPSPHVRSTAVPPEARSRRVRIMAGLRPPSNEGGAGITRAAQVNADNNA